MGQESTQQNAGGQGQDSGESGTGIPLGISTNPNKESHQEGNKGAGIFNWRAGRGEV